MALETDSLIPKPAVEWRPTFTFRIIQLVTLTNVFLVGFDSSIAAIYAIIGSSFQDANNAIWISTSYFITATSFQPLYGRFSCILGRRVCFLIATLIFMLGNLLCGVAPNMLFLNLARAFTGIGGGGLQSIATIIMSDLVPFQIRGKYQAYQNLSYGTGCACGAGLGAYITQKYHWRFMFLFQVPISLFGIIFGALYIKNPSKNDDDNNDIKLSQVDLGGSFTLVIGLASLIAGLSIGGNDRPWSDPLIITFLVVSFIVLPAFCIVECKVYEPIIPPRLLHGSLAISNLSTNFLSGAACMSYLFLIPLYFEAIKQEDAGTVGRRLIIPALGFPVGGLLAGYIMSTYGYLNRLVQVGCLIIVTGITLPLTLFNNAGTNTQLTYFFSLLPLNIGQGLVNPSSLFTLIAAFSHSDQAVSTSAVYLFRNIGAVIGVTVTSTIYQNYIADYLPESLSSLPNCDEIVDQIRHSVESINDVPEGYRNIVKNVINDGLHLALATSLMFAIFALFSTYWAHGGRLDRKGSQDTLNDDDCITNNENNNNNETHV